MKINNQAEYDAAKIKLSGADESLIYYAELKAEMLEYRRANNIFEVGDLVVFSNLDETKPILMKIKEFRNFNLVYLEIVDSGICGPSYKDDIRHATDAEIEANRRLDLPESVVLSLREVS